MQLTLSLNRRTHLFIKDGKLFFKLYKQSKFTEKVQARTASSMPVAFAVEDSCYQSLPITNVTMRLVIVAKDGKPYFKLLINALDLLQLDRANKFVELINADLAGEFDVMLGGFDA